MDFFTSRGLLYIAWIQAIAATGGSLYFSQVQDLPPCLLCWYQRIFMFPLVIILAVGIWKRDALTPYFVLPLSIIGSGIAFYHYLLQRGVIPESAATCSTGVSCTTEYVEYLGFITIPFLSLAAFLLITLCMILYLYLNKSNHLASE